MDKLTMDIKVEASQLAAAFAAAIARGSTRAEPRREEPSPIPEIAPARAQAIKLAMENGAMPTPRWISQLRKVKKFSNPSIFAQPCHVVMITARNDNTLLFEVIDRYGHECAAKSVFDSSIDMKYEELVKIGNGSVENRAMAVCRSAEGALSVAIGKTREENVFTKLYAVVDLLPQTQMEHVRARLKFGAIVTRRCSEKE